MKSPRLFALALSLLLQACAVDPKVEPLQHQVQDLSKTVDELKKDLADVKERSSLDKFIRDTQGVAYLTPGDNGYSVIATDFGPLTVTLEDIKPYANGSRVALRFGNPTSATLLDVSATVEWGSVNEKGTPLNDQAKAKDVSFNRSFSPGHWNTVAVVLDGVPPANLGFVRIMQLKNKGISLLK